MYFGGWIGKKLRVDKENPVSKLQGGVWVGNASIWNKVFDFGEEINGSIWKCINCRNVRTQ